MIDSVKGSRKIEQNETDDLESAFATRRASVTESSAVSVEWPLLKPDCLASSLLYCEKTVRAGSLKSFSRSCFFNYCSMVLCFSI